MQRGKGREGRVRKGKGGKQEKGKGRDSSRHSDSVGERERVKSTDSNHQLRATTQVQIIGSYQYRVPVSGTLPGNNSSYGDSVNKGYQVVLTGPQN